MIGIDDLLLAFASAAGKSAAQELAKELVWTITHNLATKEDIARAVIEIERYVHQEFKRVEQKAIVVDVDTAIRSLQQYERSGLPTDLSMEDTQLLLNRAATEIQQAIYEDENYPWREFVVIARFVTVSTAFWSVKVFDMQEPREIPNLVAVLIEGLSLLQKSLKLIHAMEDETISTLNVEHKTEREPPTEDTRTMYHHFSRASYEMRRGRYESGVRRADTGWLVGQYNSPRAEQLLRGEYQTNVARIQDEASKRQEKIYVPLNNSIASLRELIIKLGGTPEESMLRFGIEINEPLLTYS
jgi:hypothetical protein